MPTSPGRRPSVFGAGVRAPDFTLKSTPDQSVSLREFVGRPVVLAFYPADWSPVGTDQLGLYAQGGSEFKRFDAEILGISVDGIWSHLGFAKGRPLNFPLLSDFEPKGAVSRQYAAFESTVGESARALFVIDNRGVIRSTYLSPDGINPGADLGGRERTLTEPNSVLRTTGVRPRTGYSPARGDGGSYSPERSRPKGGRR